MILPRRRRQVSLPERDLRIDLLASPREIGWCDHAKSAVGIRTILKIDSGK
jgi:hypothetical protein